MVKIPNYFNKVATQYWSSNPRSQRNDTGSLNSQISRRSGMYKTHSRLPIIRNTGQGKLSNLIKIN